MGETTEKAIGSPWLKLYRQRIQEGDTHDEAVKYTESVLGPAPPGTIYKSASADDGEDISLFVKVAKVDESLGLVMGFAILCKVDGEEYFDSQGDHVSEQEMLTAATDFMVHSQAADEMHDEVRKGGVVFSFPLTAEIAKAFEIETKTTGWMVAAKPDDTGILAKFKSGEYTGFSIGGKALREAVVA